MVWLTVASAALLWALNLWHCAECLTIRPSPNPSAMNNFHGRCTLITFPFKWHCCGLSRSLISVRILLQAFYCWQTKPPKSPRIFSAWLTADSQQPLLQCVLLNWPLYHGSERDRHGEQEREIYTCLSAWARGWRGSLPTTLKGPVGLREGRTFSVQQVESSTVDWLARWTFGSISTVALFLV